MLLVSRRPGDDAWRFRESCPDVLRAGSNPSHVWSEKRARVQWMNAAMSRVSCGRFVRFGRSRGQQKKGSAKRRGLVLYDVRRVNLEWCQVFGRWMVSGKRADRLRWTSLAFNKAHNW